MLKKQLYEAVWGFAWLFSVVFISCSEKEFIATDDEEITTSVSVEVPEVFRTRAVPDVYPDDAIDGAYIGESGFPSIGNVDLKEHPLSFTVGVYIEKKKASADEAPSYALVDKQAKTGVKDANAYFNFRLLRNQKYLIVAYADYNAEAKEDLEAISYTTELNNELSDAFFANQEFVAKEDLTVVLKRPFGKLRLIARDFNTFASGEAFKIKGISVAFKGTPMLATDTFNALTGDFNYDKDAQGDHLLTADPVVYTKEYNQTDGKTDYATVFTMYLPANFGDEDDSGAYQPEPPHTGTTVPQSWMYPFDVTVNYEGANDKSVQGKVERSFSIDIPVKRNWLTTVDAANFWADNSGIKVTIDHCFEGKIDVGDSAPVTVLTADELQAAINKIVNEAPLDKTVTVGKIVLGANIDASQIGCFMFDTYPNDLKKTVEIYLDLNNHTITTNGPKPGGAKGVVNIYSRNSILHIDDNSQESNGGIEYTGDSEKGYPLITCAYGGQVVINRGNFLSTSTSEVVYIYEQESQRAAAQILALNAIGITPANSANYPTKPTNPDDLKKIEEVIRQLTSTATINGGWFENANDTSTPDRERVAINPYNVREYSEDKKTGCWSQWHDYAKRKGYPDWTDWGEYRNQTFSFVHINGGSFVEFDPSKGDNIVGNLPNKWIGDGHVEKETVNGKTVYTVVPKKSPEYL